MRDIDRPRSSVPEIEASPWLERPAIQALREEWAQSACMKATRSCFSALVSLSEHEVEELNRIFERQQAAIVQVRRRILDASKRERLDLPVRHGHVLARSRAA